MAMKNIIEMKCSLKHVTGPRGLISAGVSLGGGGGWPLVAAVNITARQGAAVWRRRCMGGHLAKMAAGGG